MARSIHPKVSRIFRGQQRRVENARAIKAMSEGDELRALRERCALLESQNEALKTAHLELQEILFGTPEPERNQDGTD